MWVAICCGFLCGCVDAQAVLNDIIFDPPEYDECSTLAQPLSPGIELPDVPADLGLDYEVFNVYPAADVTVRGWLIYPTTDEVLGTVLLSTGSRGRRACYLFWSEFLSRAGYQVVMYAYEGFDDSSGAKDLEVIMRDARAVLDWVIDSDDPARQQVVVFGVSLGSGPSMRLAVERPEQVAGIILDSPYVLPPESQFASIGGFLGSALPIILDSFPAELDNLQNVISLSQPLLVLHGELDDITPPVIVAQMFLAAPNPFQFVLFGDTGHAEALFEAPEKFEEEVLTYLEMIYSGESVAHME
ncbi:MAG: hypothetical protein HJJLKODD_02193 [Phycisphaerae bacterium]|nr:hypothetical protein [Phycisphaerae bacterium]